MLNRDFSGALGDARHAAKSLRGRCGELSDLLSRIAGEDIADLSTLMPTDFADLSDLISETIQKAITVLHNKAESDRETIENCVLCGEATGVARSMPVTERDHYAYGVGQLCQTCGERHGIE